MWKRLIASVVVSLAFVAALAGCEEDPGTIKAVNHWDRVVVFSVDSYEVGRLQPLTNKKKEVKAGTHKITLTLEDGSVLFEQSIWIESGQFVNYHVQSDGTILTSGGDNDPYT
jgi:hypothetical protein